MRRYYFIDSNGPDTNLQLYSLKQAKLYWEDLENEVAESDDVPDFHERCVFIVSTMGLSISQLLGQNNPTRGKKVPQPSQIFDSLIDKHGLDQALKARFQDFIDAYDHCRHFGLTEGDIRHFQVSQVTFDRTRSLYSFGLTVWDLVIEIYRKNPKNELEQLELENVHREP
jgi:hypothetical protein